MANIVGAFQASLFVPTALLASVRAALDVAPAIFYDVSISPFPTFGPSQVYRFTVWCGASSIAAAQTAITTALVGVSGGLALGVVTAL